MDKSKQDASGDGASKTGGKRRKRKTKESSGETQKLTGEEEKKILMEDMRQFIQHQMPNWSTSPYFVPPQLFQRTIYNCDEERSSLGHDVIIQTETPLSDHATDKAQSDVMRSLRYVISTNPEALVVLSNYPFENYLLSSIGSRKQQLESIASSRSSEDTHKKGASSGSSDAVSKSSDAAPESSDSTSTSSDPTSKSSDALSKSSDALSKSHDAFSKASKTASKSRDAASKSSDTSSKSTNAPSKSSDAPSTYSKSPSKSGDAPSKSSDAPSKSSDAPSKSNDAPPTSNDAPSKSSDALSKSSDAPSKTKGKTDALSGIHPSRKSMKAKTFFPNQDELSKDQKRGDFDVIIISRQRGFIVIEVKAVGYDLKADGGAASGEPGEAVPEDIVNRLEDKIKQAMKQLSKAGEVLNHMCSDLPEKIPVTKAVAFPNVTRKSLRSILERNQDLAEEAVKCFGVSTTEEALARFLCSDEVAVLRDETAAPESGKEETTDGSNPLLTWWSRLTRGKSPARNSGTEAAGGRAETQEAPSGQLSEDIYVQIIARFCGPYSKVTIESLKGAPEARTVSDCIHLTGLRFGRHILRQDQLHVLDSQDKFVFLTGPPGSGKTLVLGLKAVEWAREGDHVVIIRPQGLGWGGLISWTLFNEVVSAVQSKPHTKAVSKSGDTPGNKSEAKPADSCVASSDLGRRSDTSTTDSIGDGKESASRCVDYGLENLKTTTTRDQDGACTQALPNQDGACTQASPSQDGTCGQTLPSNVHSAMVSKGSDVEKLVRDLLEKYPGSPLRFIVDECPLQVSEEHLHSRLSGSHGRLEQARETLQAVTESVHKRKTAASSECSDVGDETETSRKHVAAVKNLLAKIDHHLDEIGNRLQIFQPANLKPTVTQSRVWKDLVSNIAKSCRDIGEQAQQLQAVYNDAAAVGTVTRESNYDDDKVIKGLEKTEATLLESSGIIFNVETNLDFFAFNDLLMTVSTLHPNREMSLWGSGVYPSFHPVNYVQKHLKLCVRCPPRIQQVLKYVEEDFAERPNYTYQCTSLPDDRFSLPTDGPDEELLDHSGHVNEAKDIKDCRSCGQLLADYIDRLRSQNSSLRFEDIVISGTFDICGISCELLQALVERDIPLQFADDSLESPPPYRGKIFVTGSSALQGLEAKIVVFVPDVSRIPVASWDYKQFRHNLPLWLRDLGRWNRLNLWFVASRCLSQLVVFQVKRSDT